ncbi:MAG: hypothetical protein OIF48_17315 [Silicimonas sp.]|nr:hypothetical protein [Silicimonas sp.]
MSLRLLSAELVDEIGPMIIRCAQGLVEDWDLAEWLRARAG